MEGERVKERKDEKKEIKFMVEASRARFAFKKKGPNSQSSD